MNVLVTGAGGPAGVCVIKSLRGRYGLIATDVDPLASGLYLADKGYLTRPATDPKFVSELVRLSKRERVRVLLPTVQEELGAVARSRERFENVGTIPIVSGTESIAIASDKERTYRFFRGRRYCPKVFRPSEVEFPVVVKPVRSRGGRGFHVCRNRAELRGALSENRRLFGRSITMEFVPGTEYSVYGLSGPDGRPRVIVPVRRIQAVSESKKAQVVRDVAVERVVREIASELHLVGPWNVQVMKSGSRVTLIEVNPRFAGTVSLVVASGVDLPKLAIQLFLGREVPDKRLEIRNRLFMTRYNEEVFVEPGEVIRRHA
jgi:carbamoyl-phosphate synthase large subunit